jgi:hypothetical protein
MSEIVCVQPLFCPTKDMFEFNKKSICSLANFMNTYNYNNIDCVFGGYGQPEYINHMLYLYKKYFSGRCKFYKFENNFGKAYIVNHLISEYLENHPETKYILTFDSDILFNCNQPIFDRLLYLIPKIEQVQQHKFGLIALNMKGDNAHWLDKFDKRVEIDGLNDNKEIVSWPSCHTGIGGGCLFISVEAWKKINGYKVVGIYAPEDAILMHEMYNNGFGISVVETLFITHPGTKDDSEYQNWKIKTSQKRMTYENATSYHDSFWNMKRDREVKQLISNVSYIILYKEEFIERKNNLIMLLEMLENYFGDSLEIQIIEQDTTSKLTLPFNRPNIKHTFIYNNKPFNRSWAFNVGVKKTDKDILAFADTDIVMKKEELIHAIYNCIYLFDAVNPFKNGMIDIIDLNVVNLFKISKKVDDNIVGVNQRELNPSSGLLFMKRCLFMSIGGWDEGFEGWGAEDNAFSHKLKLKNKFITQLDYSCFHLPHPRHGPHDNPKYRDNCNLLNSIMSMSGIQFEEYIKNQIKVIGNEFKYKQYN